MNIWKRYSMRVSKNWVKFNKMFTLSPCLDDRLEQTLLAAMNQSQQQGKIQLDSFPVDPQLLAQLQQNMPLVKEQLQQQGHAPVLVVMPQLRPLMARYARSFSKGLKVLSYNEIPEELRVEVIGTLG